MAESEGETFSILLQQLIEQCNIIESLKVQEDGVCQDLRLLLKPWPKPKKEKPANKVGPALPVNEEIPKAPEVVLAEKALAKAEKTRNKFKDKAILHLSNHEVAGTENESLQSQSNAGAHIIHNPTDPDEVIPEIPVDHESTPREIPVNQDSNSLNPQPEIAVIPQSQLDRLLESQTTQHQGRATYRANAKPAKPSSSSRVTSKSGGSKQSGTNLQKDKYKPAFKSAPFQTSAPVKKQKPGLTRTQMLRANANLSKAQSAPSNKGGLSVSNATGNPSQRIGHGLSQPRVKSATRDQHRVKSATGDKKARENSDLVKKDSTNHRDVRKSSRTDRDGVNHKSRVLTGHAGNELSSQTYGRAGNTIEVRHGQVNIAGIEVDGLERRLGKMGIGNVQKYENSNNNGNNNPCEECTEQEIQEELPFLLQRDGNNLKLPQKLGRLLSTNRKMREKLRLAGFTKKAQDTTSARDHFLHRMDQYFSQNLTEEQLDQLQNRQQLCDEYQRLYGIFMRVCNTYLCDTSSWQKVLRCKRHMEHVFITFTELEDRFFSLCSGRRKTELVTSNYKEIANKIASNNGVSTQYWLSTKLIPDTLTLSPVVEYGSVKELSEYTSLLHKLQTLKWQLHVMDQVAKDVLPSLQKANCDSTSQEFQLYRCAYSMLCSGGTTFPALVHDSEESDETNESLTDQFDSDDNT